MNEKQTVDSSAADSRREQLPVRRPAVDIWEDAQAVHMVVELPGVAKEDLSLHVEKSQLQLVGRATAVVPQGYEQSGAEFVAGSFQRVFHLSELIDSDGIQAALTDGLLKLTLPKRAAAIPRKISIG